MQCLLEGVEHALCIQHSQTTEDASTLCILVVCQVAAHLHDNVHK